MQIIKYGKTRPKDVQRVKCHITQVSSHNIMEWNIQNDRSHKHYSTNPYEKVFFIFYDTSEAIAQYRQ
jgi:hypothetical protein